LICPRCGKRTDKLISGMCINCYIDKIEVRVKNDKVMFCPRCERIKVGKSWKGLDALAELIESRLRSSIEEPVVKVESISFHKDKMYVRFLIEGKVDSQRVRVEREIMFRIVRQVCPDCSAPDRFDVKMQFRGNYEDAFDYALSIARGNVKVERKKEGMDLLVRDKKAAKGILKELKKRFSFDIKESYKLIGEDVHSGKKRYKTTYSLRFY